MSKFNNNQLINELNKKFEEIKKAELQLFSLNEELHEANKKLSESESFKSHFIAHISNELINPFTSIMGIANNILGMKEENYKEVINMVQLIYKEAFFLDFELKNLFTAAKIEAGELAPEITKVSPVLVINECIQSFKLEIDKRSLHIEHETELDSTVKINTDQEKLHLLVSNLISNAVKFSEPNSTIKMHTEFNNGSLVYSITNKGNTIPKEKQKEIYDRFTRLNNEINSLNQGSGMGLSICKSLIDILAGDITINTLGDTMLFTIRIPESEIAFEGFEISDDDLFFDE